MKTKIKSNEYIELYFDEELSIYSWKFLPETKSLNEEGIKNVLELMMTTMKKHNPKFVIADDRENLATFTVEIQEWIGKITVDALQACKTQKVAIVRPKELINDLATEQAVDEAKKIGGEIKINMFFDIEEAEDWIHQRNEGVN